MNILPFLPPRAITVFHSPAVAGEPVVELIAELSLLGPVTVLDGGNCFPAYRLIRSIRARTVDLRAVLQRVIVRRAFTCFQMQALLDGTPSMPQPCIILDPLATFYDEQVREGEVRRLLDACLRQVERLAGIAPVLLAIPPARTAERAFLVERICSCAAQLYSPEFPALPAAQLTLF
jgi:hypothetical protein